MNRHSVKYFAVAVTLVCSLAASSVAFGYLTYDTKTHTGVAEAILSDLLTIPGIYGTPFSLAFDIHTNEWLDLTIGDPVRVHFYDFRMRPSKEYPVSGWFIGGDIPFGGWADDMYFNTNHYGIRYGSQYRPYNSPAGLRWSFLSPDLQAHNIDGGNQWIFPVVPVPLYFWKDGWAFQAPHISTTWFPTTSHALPHSITFDMSGSYGVREAIATSQVDFRAQYEYKVRVKYWVKDVPDPPPDPDPTPDPIPEPSTIILLGIGALGLVGYGIRRRKRV
jgi:hypothetical protein